MDEFRKSIDLIDNQLMELLINRLHIVKEIGEYKRENNLPILDKNREQLIYDKINNKYISDVENNFVKSIYIKLMEETKKIQS
jgi:monofunctional chorismate mutase|uniref:Chorismate mutase domain-containing protein n=1 Tax=viral metagenome TaxID=1070528 RepID=A0A6C0J6T1_9ZZZZ